MLSESTQVGLLCCPILFFCATVLNLSTAEFMTPVQVRQAYGDSPIFSLMDPVTELFQDSHRCKFSSFEKRQIDFTYIEFLQAVSKQ